MIKYYIILLLALSSPASVLEAGAAETIPAIRLTANDIVQDSIKQVRWSTNGLFAVKWSYTETGAQRMLDFWGKHAGEKVCIQVGRFETPPFVAPGRENPITHEDWQADWIKRRTDKFINLKEADAGAVVAGLKEP